MEPPPARDFLAAIRSAADRHGDAARRRLEKVWEAAAAAVAEGFSTLADTLAESAREALESERRSGREEGREQIVSALLGAVRRMQAAGSRAGWLSALADAAALFSGRCAVFLLRGEFLDAVEARGFPGAAGERIIGARVRLGEAPAFRNVIESGEPAVVLCTPGELSGSLTQALDAAEGSRAWLVPVRQAETTIAVLYADGDPRAPEAPGLELVAAAAGWTAREPAWSLQEREAAEPSRQPREAPDWSRLSRREQELHLEAQRFARVLAAEIRLHHDQAVRAGRAQGKLYALLKRQIDEAREAFRRQFVEASPTMTDYLHRELVRTLANEDPAALGTDYPGPLV